MLEKKVKYFKKVPIEANVCSIYSQPVHFHSADIEIVVVLKGTIKIIVGYRTLLLHKGEVFIFNDGDLHGIYSTEEENLVLVVSMNITYFTRNMNNITGTKFLMAATYVNNERYDIPLEQLKDRLFHVAKMDFNEEESDVLDVCGRDILSFLFDNFQYFYFTAAGGRHFINKYDRKSELEHSDRMNNLVEYIWANYDRRITLKEYAEETNINMYYLSHIIKRHTGLSFQELLNFSRIEEAEKLLLGTNMKVSEIALNCGFSATRYFIKHFMNWFQESPDEYRSKNIERVYIKYSEEILPKDKAIEEINVFLNNKYVGNIATPYFYTDIFEIDGNKVAKNRKKPYSQIIEYNVPNTASEYEDRWIELLHNSFEMVIRIRSGEDVNDRLLNIIDKNRRNHLIISHSDIIHNEPAKLLHQFSVFCKRTTREKIYVYIQCEDSKHIREHHQFYERLVRCGDDSDCKLVVKKVMITNHENYENTLLMDSIYAVPWIIKNVLKPESSIKILNSLFDNNSDSDSMVIGERGIITANGIKKPAFYAYWALAQLGNKIIKDAEGWIVTKKGENLQILFYDYDISIFENIDNGTFSAEDLVKIVKESDKEYKLLLNNMEGKYSVTEIKISRSMCLLNKSFDLGMPKILTKDEELLLKMGTTPEIEFGMLKSQGNTIKMNVNVPSHGAVMILMRKHM